MSTLLLEIPDDIETIDAALPAAEQTPLANGQMELSDLLDDMVATDPATEAAASPEDAPAASENDQPAADYGPSPAEPDVSCSTDQQCSGECVEAAAEHTITINGSSIGSVQRYLDRVAIEEQYIQDRHEAERNYSDAGLVVAEIEGHLKRAKKHQKMCLEILSEIAARNPDDGPSADAATPAVKAKAAADSVAGADPVEPSPAAVADEPASTSPDVWRLRPSSELLFEKINGISKSKAAAIYEAYPTVGEIEDLRGSRGFASIERIGKGKADEMTDRVIDWLTANRDAAAFAEAAAGATEGSVSGQIVINDAAGEVLDPSFEVVEDLAEPLIDLQEDLTDDERQGDLTDEEWATRQLVERVQFIRETPPEEVSRQHFADGKAAFQKGVPVIDCTWTAGLQQDSWIKGWIVGERLAALPAASVED